MIRDIITIDEDKCTGCGLCIPNCPEGALQVVEGKARVISDMFCDGLGACIGECPEKAMHVETREAEAYDEATVIENIITQGDAVVDAHLEHLHDHGETDLLAIALQHVNKSRLSRGLEAISESKFDESSAEESATEESGADAASLGDRSSQLRQWPVQMHLISPNAPYFKESDVVIAADCTAFAAGDFHERFIKDKTIAVGCPKLDSEIGVYEQKITAMIDEANISSLTVVIMQVPCCRGLLALTQAAREKANRDIPLRAVVLSVEGEVLAEEEIA